MVQPLAFFVIAGEPSGDALGAALMAGLKTRVPDARWRTVDAGRGADEPVWDA
jgi:lipid-A-disaccharide synthase